MSCFFMVKSSLADAHRKIIKEGDLAFFGEKKVTHVGIVLKNKKIIHAFGKVKVQ